MSSPRGIITFDKSKPDQSQGQKATDACFLREATEDFPVDPNIAGLLSRSFAIQTLGRNEMLISVTDDGMAPHEYDKKCSCRGCRARRKAKTRAALIASLWR